MSDIEVQVNSKPAEDGAKRITKSFESIERAANKLAKNTTSKLRLLRQEVDNLTRLRGPSADISKRLTDLGNALSSFRAPNSTSVKNVRDLLNVLSNAGRISPSSLAGLNTLKGLLAGFKGPSPASINNTRALFKALASASTPRNLNGVVSGLNAIASAAQAANASVSTLAASLNRLHVAAVGGAGAGGGGGRGGSKIRQWGTEFRILRSESLSLSGALLRTAVSFQALLSVLAIDKFIEINTTFQQVESTLNAVTNSSELAAEQFGFVARVSEDLGIDLLTAEQGFASLLASIQGTAFGARDVQSIFQNISQASRVLHLSIADTQGVFRALTQIMSKGSLQSEELRGQLGDRLPGAFSAMAEALGVSQGELQKLMKQGKITGQVLRDGLIKFAEIYAKRTAPGLEKATKGLQATISRLSTDFSIFARVLGEAGFNDSIITFAQKLSDLLSNPTTIQFALALGNGLKWIANNLELVGRILATVVVVKMAFWLNQLASATGLIGGISAALGGMRTAIAAGATAMGVLSAAVRGLGAFLIANPIGVLLTIGAAVISSWILLNNETEDQTSKQKELNQVLYARKKVLGELYKLDNNTIENLKVQKTNLLKVKEAELRLAQATLKRAQASTTAAIADSEAKVRDNSLAIVQGIPEEQLKAEETALANEKTSLEGLKQTQQEILDLQNEINELRQVAEYEGQSSKFRHRANSTFINGGGVIDDDGVETGANTVINALERVTDKIREYQSLTRENNAVQQGGLEALFKQQDASFADDIIKGLEDATNGGEKFAEATALVSKALETAGFYGKDLKEQLTLLGQETSKADLTKQYSQTALDLEKAAAASKKFAEVTLQGDQAVKDYQLDQQVAAATDELRARGLTELANKIEQLIRFENHYDNLTDTNKRNAEITQEIKWLQQEIAIRSRGLPDQERELEIQKELFLLRQTDATGQEIKDREKLLRQLQTTNKVNDDLIERMETLKGLAFDIKDAFSQAFTDIIIKGGDVKEVLTDLLYTLAEMLFKVGTQKLFENIANQGFNLLGNLFGGGITGYGGTGGLGGPNGAGFFNAMGNAFNQGRPVAFANGGIVGSPTLFDIGMMGEAGPEAIMPLTRGANGKLGVAASGGGGNIQNNFNVTVNVSGKENGETDEAHAKRIGKEVNRQLETLVIRVIDKQYRPGGRFHRGL